MDLAFSRRLETKTVNKMIIIYCRDTHGPDNRELCSECKSLQKYAAERIEKCIFGDDKPVCSKCPVHCYRQEMREAIKEIMRYSGPKMLTRSPLLSIRHLYRQIFKSNPKKAISRLNR
jgi:hypothetical protein